MRRVLLIAAAILLALAAPAAAQRNAYQAEADIGRLLEDARAFYDNLELDQAEAALERAVQIAERFSIRSPTIAEIHVQRGIVAHVRDKDRNEERAIEAFRDALRIDPSIRLDPLVSTPSLERLFQVALRQAGGGGGGPAGEGVSHTPPKRVKAGENVTIEVKVSPEVDERLYRVFLYHRDPRNESMQKVEMQPEGSRAFAARIPGRFVSGRRLEYYVVVEGRGGRSVGGLGSGRQPVAVEISGDFGDLASGDSLTGEEDEDDGPKRRRLVSFGLNLGTGAGFITDRAEPQNQSGARIRPGGALAPFHTLVELDFWITERLSLGAYARIQIIEFAHLEGGRLKFVAVSQGAHHLVVRAGGGVGRVRHLVDLGTVLDTTLEGPYHYTLGASYVLDLSRRLALVISPDFLHLIGDSPSFHFDLNFGLQVSF